MGKVLADTTPEAKDLFDRRACRGGGGIVDKVAEDAVGQFDDGICPRTSCRKRLRGPAGKRLEGADQRRLKAELLRLDLATSRSSRYQGDNFLELQMRLTLLVRGHQTMVWL